MAESRQTDAMIMRLNKELEERNGFVEGIVTQAQDADRDLTDNEKEMAVQARSRIVALDEQLKLLNDSKEVTMRARMRATEVHEAMERARGQADNGPVEYRSTGHYVVD